MIISATRILHIVGVVLLVSTLASYGVGGIRAAGGPAFAFVMLVASGKAYLIARYFMDLAVAPRYWRMIFGGLIIAAGAVTIALHFVSVESA